MSTAGGPEIVNDGLVLHLDAANPKSYVSGSSTWKNLISNDYDGVISGSSFSSGKYGVLSFDGTDDYVEITDPPDPQNNTGEWTVDVWLKSISGTGDCCWVEWDGSAHIWQYSSETDFFCNPRGGTSSKTISNAVLLDEWANYTVTFNTSDDNISMYVNGKLEGSFSETGLPDTNSSVLRIGRRVGDSRVFDGNFGICKIYNKSLSQQEVKQNYNATKSRFGL